MQKTNDGILNKAVPQHHGLADLEDYAELVSKQFASRIEQITTQQLANKKAVERLYSDCKNNPK